MRSWAQPLHKHDSLKGKFYTFWTDREKFPVIAPYAKNLDR